MRSLPSRSDYVSAERASAERPEPAHRNALARCARATPSRSFMSTDATLTSKGQTTIPNEIRDSLHMKEGDRITFTFRTGVKRKTACQSQ